MASTTAPWPTRAARGAPVVPDVNWATAGVVGSDVASELLERPPPDVDQLNASPSGTTSRSEGWPTTTRHRVAALIVPTCSARAERSAGRSGYWRGTSVAFARQMAKAHRTHACSSGQTTQTAPPTGPPASAGGAAPRPAPPSGGGGSTPPPPPSPRGNTGARAPRPATASSASSTE